MNTEQLKQDALKAPKGKWEHFVLDKPLRDVPAYVEKCIDASPGQDFYFVLGQHPEGGEADICHVGNGPSAEAIATYIAAANPSVILTLLECVDALKDMLSEVEDGIATSPLTRVTARAALKNLENL